MPSKTNGFWNVDVPGGEGDVAAVEPALVRRGLLERSSTMYQANIQPVAYVVCLSSRPWAWSRLVEQLDELVVGEMPRR